jgi:hypothetical protein
MVRKARQRRNSARLSSGTSSDATAGRTRRAWAWNRNRTSRWKSAIPHRLTARAFGTTEGGVASILLNSLINAACDGTSDHPPSEQDVNGILAAVHGIRASDEIEAMLAVQMVATHFAATRALRRLKGSDMVSQQDSNGNLAVKLLRTFAAQTEALLRYRGKGQQKVTVEHVHIHTGGQAIVGSVSQSGGGRDNDENRGQPHSPENAGAITFASGTTLPSANEAREAMPVASGRR